jgi:hypothetical protein
MTVTTASSRMTRDTYPRQTPPKFLRTMENDASNTSRRIRKMENAKKKVETDGEVYRHDKSIATLKEHLSRVATNILDVRAKLMPSNPAMAIRRKVCNKGSKKHMLGQFLYSSVGGR